MARISPVIMAIALVGILAASAGPSYAQRNRAPINPDRIIREQARPVTPPMRNGPPINPAQVLRDQQSPMGNP